MTVAHQREGSQLLSSVVVLEILIASFFTTAIAVSPIALGLQQASLAEMAVAIADVVENTRLIDIADGKYGSGGCCFQIPSQLMQL